MITKIIIASIIGAFSSLDSSLFANIMISRPIVLCPILGFVFKDVALGFQLGFLFEFLFSDILYVGAYIPINISFLGTIVMGAIFLLPYLGDSLIMFVIIVAICIAYIFRHIEIAFRLFNSLVAEKIVDAVKNEKYYMVYLGIAYSLLSFLILNFFMLFFFILLTSELTKIVFIKLPYNIIITLRALYNFLPILGFAVVLNIFLAGDFKNWIKNKIVFYNINFKDWINMKSSFKK
ncbi:MAG: PTS sugar transporter subunit IIC [Elusimicrobiota bacterium]|nr:PTS sugar transporter subunit IIC [Elusimicrobiota bacterium]